MAEADAEKVQGRKRVFTIAICSTLLVAMVVAVTIGAYDEDEKGESGTSSGAKNQVLTSTKAIKSFCQPADYKRTCEETLKKEVGNQTDHKELTKLAFRVAMEQINKAANKSVTLAELEKDPRTKIALANCKQLMNFSVSELKKSFNEMSKLDLSQSDKITTNLKVWLSATITNEKTCLDGFQNASTAAGTKMAKALQTAIEMSKNGLAIIDEMARVLKQFELNGPNGRRLLVNEDDNDGVVLGHGESWSEKLHKRRLLEDNKEDTDDIEDRIPVLGHGEEWYETINNRRLLEDNTEDKGDIEDRIPVLGHGEDWYETINNRRLLEDNKEDTDDIEDRIPILGHGEEWYETINKRRRLLKKERLDIEDQDCQVLGHGEPWYETELRKLLVATPVNGPNPPANPGLIPKATVALDGSGQFRTINDAIKSIPRNSFNQPKPVVIHIKSGIYRENVKIDYHMLNMMWIGEGANRTKVVADLSFTKNFTTFATATVSVYGDKFTAVNIGFENSAGAVGYQAVALLVMSDFSVFYNCKIDGYQDTLYTHSKRQFYRDCIVSGTIDYVFGNAAAVFQNCTFISRIPLDNQQIAVTASSKSSQREVSGIVIQNSTLTAETGYDKVKFPAYLGRPWGNFSTTIFMESFMGDFLNADGWAAWDKEWGKNTCFYAEYHNHGPGADTSKRVRWAGVRNLTEEEALGFTAGKFLEGDTWVQRAVKVPYTSGFLEKPITVNVPAH